jgi:hypothetical protein
MFVMSAVAVGQAKLPSPEKIASLMKGDCTPEIAALDDVLNLPCRTYKEVAVVEARLERGKRDRVITAFDGDDLSLVVLRLERNDWRHVDTRTFASKYEEPKVSLPSLVEKGVQEVSVSQETLLRGSNVLENHQTVYKVLKGKLTLIFDQPAQAHLNGWGTETDHDEESDFRYEAADKTEPGTIYARTVFWDHGKKQFTVLRAYAWDPETERFRQTPLHDYSNAEWNRLLRFYPRSESKMTKIVK